MSPPPERPAKEREIERLHAKIWATDCAAGFFNGGPAFGGVDQDRQLGRLAAHDLRGIDVAAISPVCDMSSLA
jgi:hypothetical protein